MTDPLPLFIVQTVIILTLCYGVNILFHKIRQPRVVAEVISGIILGPSIMGQIPGFNDTIFPKQSIPFLSLVSNLGLVLFLFLVGLELDPKLIMKRAKHALGISVAGLLIPFVLSCGVAVLLYKEFEKGGSASDGAPATPPPFGQFLLTCGVAMSLTAFPVLARILAEMQLMSTTVGFITVCAAAAGDIVAWILLALLVSLINATTPIMPLYVMLMAIAWCIILVYVVRPLLLSLVRLTHSEEEPSQKMIAITLVIVLTSSFVTNIIGIHAIFGGFLVGLLIPHDSGFAEGLTRRIEDLVGVYFLPIFFACSGLKTQVSLLNNGQTWGLVLMVTLISFFGKMLGCVSAARVNGMTWREAFSIGFLMNCKGLVEYIILNIGHDAGVISDRVFVILIAMCVLLTMISTPFVGFLYPVAYQKELEVRREAERKQQALALKRSMTGGSAKHEGVKVEKAGFFAGIANKLRRRGGKGQGHGRQQSSGKGDNSLDAIDSRTDYDDLEDVRVEAPASLYGDDAHGDHQPAWKQRNGIMFCLDKTPNAPGVMTLLQLFSGTAIRSVTARTSNKSDTNSTTIAAGSDITEGGRSSKNEKLAVDQGGERYKGVLQPSIDISDPDGNRRTKLQHKQRRQEAIDEYEVNYSKIYAIRLLHISERTSAAMLTASRCMDRLYKDTVMMMVMAFAKLNSVPLKPLVAISTDSAQSTVAQDILDRAEDLNVGWIVYPWNSSHLTDLPSPHQVGQPTSGNHLQPGIMMSMANTSVTVGSSVSIPGTPLAATHDLGQPTNSAGGGMFFGYSGAPDTSVEAPRQFPYNVSRYFDHDEAQKIASGGHVDLSSSGQSHRTSIASNTKVLSKLIPSSAESNISTAVLVDRGLGLFGGVEHLVVPLLGGQDDYETLCLASCLARSTRCFVTVLRVASCLPEGTGAGAGQAYTFQAHNQHHARNGSNANDRSVPPTPHAGRHSEDHFDKYPRHLSRQGGMVPKDDPTLFKKFFPCKPLFQGGQTRHQQQILQRNRSAGRLGDRPLLGDEGVSEDEESLQDDDERGDLEEGVMALSFQEINDAILWARSCLTAQDLMVMGFDSAATTPIGGGGGGTGAGVGLLSRTPSQQGANGRGLKRAMSDLTSRVASASPDDGTRSNLTTATDSIHRIHSPPMSPPSILERRGINLSPPSRSDSPLQSRLQPLQDTSLFASSTSALSTPGLQGQDGDIQRVGRSTEKKKAGGSGLINRSRSRGARSLSRGRRPDTPGVVSNTTTGAGGSALTTCQVMLGLAADRMIQSGVVSSLLVVRSRWFLERSNPSSSHHHYHAAADILSQFQFSTSHNQQPSSQQQQQHRRAASDQQSQHSSSQQQQHRRFSQYHTEQQQHHARKFSEEMLQELALDGQGSAPKSEGLDVNSGAEGARVPDVTFVDMSSVPVRGVGGESELQTPRMSGESM
ncbi:MAG: Sodium/hydrogen exchanger family-domain-containing protein [Linnemannia elongata]|nr:MAG: Sodium/hydrogen exchanger family-domain-containing protein [Linnemannia elongata]